ncbi:hypothetical protein E0K89_000605 [Aquicoccus sp. SCR17]|nr:hypothetical protein [Carideicomes alvinocaridis]
MQRLLTGIRSAARAGDQEALLGWFASDAVFSFGSESGSQAFLELWKDKESRPFARFLSTFDEVIAPGGTRTASGDMHFPFHTRITAEDVDPYFVMHVRNGALRAAPTPTAAPVPIAPLVTVLCVDPACLSSEPPGWRRVRLQDGTPAYAPAEALSPVVSEYRLVVGRRDGRYRVLAFVAGD